MSSINPTRTLPINGNLSRTFSRTGRYSPEVDITPTPESSSPESSSPENSSPVFTPHDSPVPRPSFSVFDEIHLETPRQLQPLGLGLTGAKTSEAFRENFNRYNNIPHGGGLGNIGNLNRSNSGSSTSSRGSSHSSVSSVSTGCPEKPPAYTSEKTVEKAPVKKGWCHLSSWSPLMWLQFLYFLGFPTLTLSWIVSLVYFTLLPRLCTSRGKALDEWVLLGLESNNSTTGQEGIEGAAYQEARKKMIRWEMATLGSAGLAWTTLCVVSGVFAVKMSQEQYHAEGGSVGGF